MIKKILKTFSSFLFTVIGISFLSFCLSYLSPSDPATQLLSQQGIPVSEQVLEKVREEMGLNRPMLVQYKDWLLGFLRLDMGNSYRFRKPVTQILLQALPYTLGLTVISMLLVVLVSLPVGILCAKRAGSIVDRVVQMLTYVFASFPTFFFGLIILYILAFRLKLFSVIGSGGISGIVMPMLVMFVTLTAWHIRQVRAIILREMQNEYVVGARSRGIPEHNIFFKHILRNAILPIITLGGLSFGSLLGGSIIVENIFSWPGVGRLAIEAISNRDYPLIQAYIVWMALIFLLINFVIDILYSVLDPRVKRGLV
jgi:peptide/nickel transport system permease protein